MVNTQFDAIDLEKMAVPLYESLLGKLSRVAHHVSNFGSPGNLKSMRVGQVRIKDVLRILVCL